MLIYLQTGNRRIVTFLPQGRRIYTLATNYSVATELPFITDKIRHFLGMHIAQQKLCRKNVRYFLAKVPKLSDKLHKNNLFLEFTYLT